MPRPAPAASRSRRAPPPRFPASRASTAIYRATLNVSYELDLFGRLRASSAAARAELEASEASREAVRLALAAQAAKSYFALRALDEQVDLTRRTVSPARGGACAAAQAPAGRRDLGVRAAPARGRDRRGARAAAAARARARARGSGARRAARAHAAQRVSGRRARSGRRSKRRPARRCCRPACLPSCCCAVPTWSRPSARSPPANARVARGARRDVPLDQPDRLPRQRERGALQPVLRRPGRHLAARRRPDPADLRRRPPAGARATPPRRASARRWCNTSRRSAAPSAKCAPR